MNRIDFDPECDYDIEENNYFSKETIEKRIIEAPFLDNQEKIFHECKAKFRIVAKGRRFGFTRGLALYVMERGMKGNESILWVDTSYSNITRYIERYFLPVLKHLDKDLSQFLHDTCTAVPIYNFSPEEM